MFTDEQMYYLFIIVSVICFLGVLICLIRIMYLNKLEKKDIASKKELLNIIEQQTKIIINQQTRINNLETIITSSKLSVKELN